MPQQGEPGSAVKVGHGQVKQRAERLGGAGQQRLGPLDDLAHADAPVRVAANTGQIVWVGTIGSA